MIGSKEDADHRLAHFHLVDYGVSGIILGPKLMVSNLFSSENSFTIIGSGQVSLSKIVPALLSHGVTPANVHILSNKFDEHLGLVAQRGCHTRVVSEDHEIIEAAKEVSNPSIIATWPDTHFSYSHSLLSSGIPVAVEKPLCCTNSDLASFEQLFLGLKLKGRERHIFCLGYYVLEKALPMAALYAPGLAKAALPLLEGVRGGQEVVLSPQYFADISAGLGQILHVEIELLEGPERSPSSATPHWTERLALGGVLFDTFLHVLQLAILMLGEGRWLNELRWREGWYRPRLDQLGVSSVSSTCAHRIEALASCGSLDINLKAGKFTQTDECRRRVRLRFERGELECDFDRQDCTVRPFRGEPLLLRTRRDNAALIVRYGVQLALMQIAFSEGIEASFDARDTQLASIKALLGRRRGEVFYYGG